MAHDLLDQDPGRARRRRDRHEPNILKPLAPNTISTFYTPNMYAYNLSFAGQQYNYAATIAIIMGLITAIIAYVVQLRGSRQEAR